MTKLKSIGETSLIIAILLISLFLTYLLIVGGVIVGAKIITVFAIIYDIIFLIDLIVLIPLAFFKKTRSVSAIGLFVSSYVLGAFTWIWRRYCFYGISGSTTPWLLVCRY
jgi:phosphoglycerol transferase MdoB-like AlkP superfamily enzyme